MSTTTQWSVAIGIVIFVSGALVAAGLAAASFRRADELDERLAVLEEDTMAKFDALDQDIADIKTAVGDAAARVEAALSTLQNDSADQAAVDAAHNDLRGVLDSLNAIAQAPAPEPGPGPEPAPTEPVA